MASYLTKLFFNLLILLTNIKAKESLLVLMIMFFFSLKKDTFTSPSHADRVLS